MIGFNIIETTADIGIEASGTDEMELVENSLKGLYFICFDKLPNILESVEKVKQAFESLDELVFSLLEESIFALFTKKLLIQVISISKINNLYEVIYEKVKTDEEIQTEIKAVTKHCYKVERVDSIYKVMVIFDI
ncbi:archease [Deferribacteraceae bacterium V6Fe1]|nr:archease [Deferribacteraceae bacterium V6Fe1]